MVAQTLSLPNIRKFFVPDAGYLLVDADLSGADAQVVAAEANDAELLQMFREGWDVHAENAKLLGIDRPMAKRWVHGTNYGGSARTMAISCGFTIKDSEDMQKVWFGAHPGIADWHERTETQLFTSRTVTNKFGFRRVYFDRPDGLLPEALAWVPQSTVALVTDEAALRLYEQKPFVQLLMQVHDSLVFQIPISHRKLLPELLELMRVPIPYDNPLTIAWGAKTSTLSWGECEKLVA